MTTSLHTEENETFHKGLFYCVETGIKREVQNQEKKKKTDTEGNNVPVWVRDRDSCHLLHFGHSH